MIKYLKKEDQWTKYFVRFNETTKEALVVYRNKDGSRYGINFFQASLVVYETSGYGYSTIEEFQNKLEIIKNLIK